MNRSLSAFFCLLSLALGSCATERSIVSNERVSATQEDQLRDHFAGWDRDDESTGMASTKQRSSFEEMMPDGETYQKKEFSRKAFSGRRTFEADRVKKKSFRDKRASEQTDRKVARLKQDNPFTKSFKRESNEAFGQQFDSERASEIEGKSWKRKTYETKSARDSGKRSGFDGRQISASSIQDGSEGNPFTTPDEVQSWNKRWSIGQIKNFLEGRNNTPDTP